MQLGRMIMKLVKAIFLACFAILRHCYWLLAFLLLYWMLKHS